MPGGWVWSLSATVTPKLKHDSQKVRDMPAGWVDSEKQHVTRDTFGGRSIKSDTRTHGKRQGETAALEEKRRSHA